MREQLRRRVTLLEPTRTETDGGGAETSFAEAGAVWAEITGRSGSESTEGGRFHVRSAYELTIRFREDVRPGWRVRWAGREWRVTAVFDPDGLRTRTTITCEDEE